MHLAITAAPPRSHCDRETARPPQPNTATDGAPPLFLGRVHVGGMVGLALETTRRYLEEYDQSKWLCPSQDKGKHITIRTVEKIFSSLVKMLILRRMPQFTLSDIVLPHIYWKVVPTCGISRSCWGTKVRRRQKYIRM